MQPVIILGQNHALLGVRLPQSHTLAVWDTTLGAGVDPATARATGARLFAQWQSSGLVTEIDVEQVQQSHRIAPLAP